MNYYSVWYHEGQVSVDKGSIVNKKDAGSQTKPFLALNRNFVSVRCQAHNGDHAMQIAQLALSELHFHVWGDRPEPSVAPYSNTGVTQPTGTSDEKI